MSFSVRVVPLLLLALLSVAIPLRAQSPPKPTTKQHVTVQDGAVSEVSLALTPAPPQKP